jgi:hypothetical protein
MLDENEALLSENRRLRQEARELRERIASFERSRWWRLHPRFLFVQRDRAAATQAEPAVEPPHLLDPDDAMSAAFR